MPNFRYSSSDLSSTMVWCVMSKRAVKVPRYIIMTSCRKASTWLETSTNRMLSILNRSLKFWSKFLQALWTTVLLFYTFLLVEVLNCAICELYVWKMRILECVTRTTRTTRTTTTTTTFQLIDRDARGENTVKEFIYTTDSTMWPLNDALEHHGLVDKNCCCCCGCCCCCCWCCCYCCCGCRGCRGCYSFDFFFPKKFFRVHK